MVMIPESSLPLSNEATGRWYFHSCLSVHRGGGPHVTITHDASNLIVQAPRPAPQDISHGRPNPWRSDMEPPALPLLVTSGGIH